MGRAAFWDGMDVTDTVRTGRCNLQLFRGGSKFNYNIGNHDFWINSLKRYRPQDVGCFSHRVDALNHVSRLDSYLNFKLFHMPKR